MGCQSKRQIPTIRNLRIQYFKNQSKKSDETITNTIYLGNRVKGNTLVAMIFFKLKRKIRI